jgi:ElaB/YqjD/DUF883 family membrane-anchored ribosome-binding protein
MSTVASEVGNEKLVREFNTVVADTQHLLKSVAAAGGDKADAARAELERGLAAAGDRLARIREASLARAANAAHATDEYVHANPWQAIGIGASAGLFLGLLAGIAIASRRHEPMGEQGAPDQANG